MKKCLSILLVLLLVASAVSAASISQAVATVNLIRNEVITRAELDAELALYNAAGYTDVSELDVLESLINEKVFLQGAERDGFSISDREVDALYTAQKANLEASYGTTISDEEYEAMVIQQYGSVESFKEYIKEQTILNNYVTAKKSDMLNNVPAPTEREIKNFYRQNQTTLFTQADTQKVSVITKAKTGDEAADAAALAELQGVSEQIQNGTLTFEKGVQLYSDDLASKARGGDVGWLVDNEVARASLGDEFVDVAMNLDVGEVSGVVSTPSDWCIIKITSFIPAKILSLDDPITPDETITVREYIESGLTYQNSQLVFVEAYQSLLNDLKRQARINRIIK